MNTTIIIIGFIAIAVSVIWGTKFKTNVGIAALCLHLFWDYSVLA